MNSDPTPLFVQDVIELLTNIKLKYGNLPVYMDDKQVMQTVYGGVQRYLEDTDYGLPERVEIT